jgi:hypothetical protein
LRCRCAEVDVSDSAKRSSWRYGYTTPSLSSHENKALGLALPMTLLALADEVIE